MTSLQHVNPRVKAIRVTPHSGLQSLAAHITRKIALASVSSVFIWLHTLSVSQYLKSDFWGIHKDLPPVRHSLYSALTLIILPMLKASQYLDANKFHLIK